MGWRVSWWVGGDMDESQIGGWAEEGHGLVARVARLSGHLGQAVQGKPSLKGMGRGQQEARSPMAGGVLRELEAGAGSRAKCTCIDGPPCKCAQLSSSTGVCRLTSGLK